MSEKFLAYGRHWIDEDDIEAVARCLRGDWLTTGPAVEAFESAFAAAVGARYAVVCVNGTAALHLAALAGRVGPGDTGLAPTLSFLASANGMRYTGAAIVFADADPDTGLITPQTFEAALAACEQRPKMAVVVHLNGQPVDMPAISRMARQRGIVLVEDACHALGGSYADENGEPVSIGSCRHSEMTVFSLHPVKTITMGEGGVVTTNDPDLYARLKLVRGHGMVRTPGDLVNVELAFTPDGEVNPWYYEMQELGYNFRAPDILCALALSQLAKLPRFAERRAGLKREYDTHFADVGDLLRPIPISPGTDPVLHLYPLLIDFEAMGVTRAEVMGKLRERGIGTQVHYIPIHRQPYYADLNSAHLPGADAYYSRVLSLPYYPLMETSDARRVALAVKDVLGINA